MNKLIILIFILVCNKVFGYNDSTNYSSKNKIIVNELNETQANDFKISRLNNLSKEIREWLLALAGLGTLISISIAGWKAITEYRLKVIAEKLNAISIQTESDIKLITQFTEIMDIAHARSGYQVSETIIEKLFIDGVITNIDKQNLVHLNEKIATASILTFPVGVAAQDAAIASIATLAERHEILRQPAIQALETLSTFKPLAKVYLGKLK